jgi:formylglycine-generating enzyme required for sulfatase activity
VYAWYKDQESIESSAKDVAQLKPNKFGLYDMSGNVTEWCNDIFAPYSGDTSLATDPARISGSVSPTTDMILRGGSYKDDSERVFSAYRFFYTASKGDESTGFRTVIRAGTANSH